MDFAPVCPEQMAGFTYCYDSMNFYLLGKTCAEDGTPVLELLKAILVWWKMCATLFPCRMARWTLS